jgi:hypothetical protein
MAISEISAANANAAVSISGVRAANDQVRTLGAGLSSLLQVAEQVADRVPQAQAPAAPVDSGRGQTVDVSV